MTLVNAMEIEHLFLTKGKNFKLAAEQVRRFFRDYELVPYEGIQINSNCCVSASSALFQEEAKKAMQKNKEVINYLLSTLSAEGYDNFPDIGEIPQGYLSKNFHTLAHLLDGFFGVDSHFYNLVEDSHWISKKLQQQIEKCPGEYWLINVTETDPVVTKI